MLTSKGLMCASGVIMCRMFLTIFPPKRSLNRDVFLLADLGAPVARAADLDFHPRLAIGAGPPSQELRVVGVRREDEAGRSPGALANPARAVRRELIRDPRHRCAGESAASLNRSKIVAEDLLDPGDAVAESREIPFRC